jgi:serpin B
VLDDVDPLSFMYLMNAIYFNARWTNPFDKSKTKSENFKTLSGQSIKVGMMHMEIKETYYYSETESCQIMTLPYGRGKYSMTIFLPKETDGVAALLEDRGKINYSGLSNVKLSLPGFKTDYKIDMKSLLAGMGLPLGPYDELVENADGTPEISKVLHKATITVNETGSEAAAVTVVEMRYGASGMEPPKPRDVTFTADHPFLYTITEGTSGVILFTGIYTGN